MVAAAASEICDIPRRRPCSQSHRAAAVWVRERAREMATGAIYSRWPLHAATVRADKQGLQCCRGRAALYTNILLWHAPVCLCGTVLGIYMSLI